MDEHFDPKVALDPTQREAELAARLPGLIEAALQAPGWRKHLGSVEARSINSRAALAQLPVLRKSELIELQKAEPPFAGFVPDLAHAVGQHLDRLFSSPGPIYEVESKRDDAWRSARALLAAGFKRGHVVLNTFSYHLTPGGFIADSGARAIGCAVIPAGPGNTEQQLDVIAQLRPNAYTGTPDFLKIILDAAAAQGRDASSIKKAVVSGAAFPPSLQAELTSRGVDAYQMYATADVGCVAYESAARAGLIVNEDVLLEVVRPGTGEPVPDGEVGEVVITSFDPHHPWIRLALGDLSAVIPGISPCGRTNMRIKGWLGRADQATKVKGMFVRPEQIAAVAKRHPELGRMRLLVTRHGESDAMTLQVEATANANLAAALEESLRAATKLSGAVELVAPGSLPNDGKVIEDRRGEGFGNRAGAA